MTTKKWISIAVTAAFVIAGITLHLIQPKISFALSELLCAACFVGGAIAGYLYAKNPPKTK